MTERRAIAILGAGGALGAAITARLASEPDTDLVVSDVVMPALDGPAMARELREIVPDMPLLFMSG